MKIKCRNCKTLLIDSETGEGNYRVFRDIEVRYDEHFNPEFYWGDYYIVCTNCGRKVKLDVLKKLGVEVDVGDW